MAVTLTIGKSAIDGVDLVILDKDGTLIDVHHYWSRMVRWRVDRMARRRNLDNALRHRMMTAMGLEASKDRILPEGPVGLKTRETVLQAGLAVLQSEGISDAEDQFREVFKEVDAASVKSLDALIKPLPGLYRFVNALAGQECPMALATTDLKERAELVLDHLGIRHLFGVIVGGKCVKHAKPAGDAVALACERLGIPANRSVMIGDALSDVQAGLNAGCRAAIGLETGLTPGAILRSATPHVASGLNQITVRS